MSMRYGMSHQDCGVKMCCEITLQILCQVCMYWANLICNDAYEPCASAAAAGSSMLAAPCRTPGTEACLPTSSEASGEVCSPSTEAVVMTPQPSRAPAAVLPASGPEEAATSKGVDGKRQELKLNSVHASRAALVSMKLGAHQQLGALRPLSFLKHWCPFLLHSAPPFRDTLSIITGCHVWPNM